MSQAASMPGQRLPHPQGNEDADGIPVGKVEGERRLVRRGRKAVEVASGLHHAVRERQPSSGVVELDVTGERGVAGEDNRRRVDGEDERERADQPRRRATALPRAREHEARDREHDDDGGRELGEGREGGDEPARHHNDAKAERGKKRA